MIPYESKLEYSTVTVKQLAIMFWIMAVKDGYSGWACNIQRGHETVKRGYTHCPFIYGQLRN